MTHAPDMSPSLDDAIQAVNELCKPFISQRTTDLETIRKFLLTLDYVPPAALNPSDEEACALEAAYQAGFRVLNKIGSVMIVRTEDYLGYAVAPGGDRKSVV